MKRNALKRTIDAESSALPENLATVSPAEAPAPDVESIVHEIKRHPDKITVTVLADEYGYMVSYHAQPERSDKLLVTFDTASGRKRLKGFGVDFLLKNGFDVIHVAQLGLSSYQHLSLEDFERVVAPYVDGRPVFTYGSSLGGYAAIYFAGPIEAKAIALSPRCPAYPDTVAKVVEYNTYGFPFLHVDFLDTGLRRSRLAPVIAFDPIDAVDNVYVETKILAAYPSAELIRLEHGQHSVASSMKASGVLKALILTVVNEERTPDIKIDPMNDPRYTTKMAIEKLRENDLAACHDYLERALADGGHASCFEIIRKLVQLRALKIDPRGIAMSDLFRKKIIARYKDTLATTTGPEHFKALCDVHLHLMEYETASRTANLAAALYPDDAVLAKAVIKARGNLAFVESLAASAA